MQNVCHNLRGFIPLPALLLFLFWGQYGCATGAKTVMDIPRGAPLDIDHMLRGYFYAWSIEPDSNRLVDAWALRVNNARRIRGDEGFAADAITLHVRPNEDTLWMNAFRGMKVYLANTTDSTLIFPTQDNRLYVIVQAKDRQGRWREIEYLPSSWCGNSYYDVDLPPGQYWTFATPMQAGDHTTTLRLRLIRNRTSFDALREWLDMILAEARAMTLQEKTQMRERYEERRRIAEAIPPDTIYSNEYVGRINRWQFSNRLEYHAQGIMDPYLD